jgi:hypothetical protein
VSPLLNKYSDIYSDLYSVKDQFCVKETDFQAKFNGVYQGYQESGSQLPSWDESGSFAQKYKYNVTNCDAKGNSFKSFKSVKSGIHLTCHNNLKVPTDECFEHVFSVIGLTGAEIWPFQNLSTSGCNLSLTDAKKIWSKNSIYELTLQLQLQFVNDGNEGTCAKNKGAINGTNSLFFSDFKKVSVLFNPCQTSLMGILTKQVLGVFRPDLFNSYKTGGDTILGDTKHDKASFKHSIEWHLKEIKRPKNLVTFCFHSSFKTNSVCCVF